MTFSFDITRNFAIRALSLICALTMGMLAGCTPVDQRPVHYLPMKEGYKTLFGRFLYVSPGQQERLVPFHISGAELCFHEVPFTADQPGVTACKRLDLTGPENYGRKMEDRALFSFLVSRGIKTLQMKSITVYSDKDAYVYTFVSPPSGDVPDTEFIDFGALVVSLERDAAKPEPQLGMFGLLMYPFTKGVKAGKSGCAAMEYIIPYTIEKRPQGHAPFHESHLNR